MVTAIGDEEPVGLTCQSFTSVSLDPPLVLFCAARTSRAWPLIRGAGFFCVNVLSADPAILAIGVENHDDLSQKDTARNIRLTGEFTVNIVNFANLETMNTTAVAFPAGEDEVAAAGLTVLPGKHVKSPFIAEAPDEGVLRATYDQLTA